MECFGVGWWVKTALLGSSSAEAAQGKPIASFRDMLRRWANAAYCWPFVPKITMATHEPHFYRTRSVCWDSTISRCLWQIGNRKMKNLRRIATDLHIGLDSIVFLDDNPIERDLIRRRLP